MKFKDLVTGNVVESNNDFVVAQYKKNPTRFKEVKAKTTKPATKTNKE
jgi:hypothetical protein